MSRMTPPKINHSGLFLPHSQDCLGRLPLVFCLQMLRPCNVHPGVTANRIFFVEAPPPVSGAAGDRGNKVLRFVWNHLGGRRETWIHTGSTNWEEYGEVSFMVSSS